MDLRGEEDVIGWLSLTAVEQDTSALERRSQNRKWCRPSARKKACNASQSGPSLPTGRSRIAWGLTSRRGPHLAEGAYAFMRCN